jgi:hypothetical protein
VFTNIAKLGLFHIQFTDIYSTVIGQRYGPFFSKLLDLLYFPVETHLVMVIQSLHIRLPTKLFHQHVYPDPLPCSGVMKSMQFRMLQRT